MTTETQTQITRLENAKADIITAIENKGIIVQSGTKLDGMASFIDAIPTGSGGTEMEDAFVTRTLSGTYENSRVTDVGIGAFAYWPGNYNVSFPNVVTIKSSAFFSATGLRSASFTVATAIQSRAFSGCTYLVSAIFPSVTAIGSGAFAGCLRLKTISLPLLKTIPESAFDHCTALVSARFPKVTTVGLRAFQYASSSLARLYFDVVSKISASAFSWCFGLVSLYLLKKAVCTLDASTAFTSTPFLGYAGYTQSDPHIYVPSAYLSSYKNATNWTYFSSYFVGLTDAQISAL